ncbi:MAG TPA: DUF6603 domain-containing protein [Methylomirabilota bacterium]|nr:DUF6603 domain-containing protein [Methylomirabilota bacterium]
MKNQLAYLYLALRDFVDPLRRRLDSPEALEHLFHRYGWIAPLDQPVFDRVRQAAGVTAPIEQFLVTADTLQQRLDADPDAGLGVTDLAALAQGAEALLRALAEFKPSALTGLAAPLDRAEFWESIGEHVVDDLLEEYLRVYRPGAFLLLRLWGAIRYEPTSPARPFRRPYIRILVDWDRAVEMVKDPLTSLQRAYHWGDPVHPFDHQGALEALASVLRAMRLPAIPIAPAVETRRRFLPDPGRRIQEDVSALRTILLQGASFLDQTQYKIGFEVFPAAKAGQPRPSGLMVKPLLEGSSARAIPLGATFSLRFTIAADQGDAIGLALFPGEANMIGGGPAVGTRLEIASEGSEPWYLVGNSRTSRIELSGLSLGLSLEGSLADPEIRLRLATAGKAGQAGGKVVIPLEDSDRFVQQSVKRSSLEFAFSPEIVWSSKTGLAFNGKPRLDVDVPVNIGLGPVTLTNAIIAVGPGPPRNGTSSLALRVGMGIRGALGPLEFVIENIGFVLSVARYTRQDLLTAPDGTTAPALGGLGVDLAFAPPTGIGLGVDTEIITGGGYLECFPERGEYIGVAQFSLRNRITIKAFGVVLTEPRVSILLVISADFPPVQLGLGFQLTGVGGLIGIHRRLDSDRLLKGLRDNVLDDVLFPKDPLKDPRGLVGRVGDLFPPSEGHHVFGPMGLIAWGPKSLVTIEVGLILEVPFSFRVHVVGVLKTEVSKRIAGKDLSVLKLQVNFAGLFDFEERFIRFDASLYQSALLDLPLDGEMALRLRYGQNPDFVLTLGGFHPDFQPPALSLPPDLRRLQVTLHAGNPHIWVDAYLAVTPNTVQFGASGHLRFKKWGVGISGDLGFDALFQFNPFRFEAGVYLVLSASWKGHDFASIEIDGTFSGPSPWRIQGSFKLKICWFLKISVSIDESWGDSDETQLGQIEVMPALLEDLGAPASWERTPGRSRLLVTCRRIEPAAADLLLHPNDLVSVRQSTVPLGLRIDKFGEKRPQGASRFRIKLQGGGQALEGAPLRAHFAPAQFFDRSQEDQLAAQPYELLEAGAGFEELDAVLFDNWKGQGVAYESAYVDDPALTPREPAPPRPETLEGFRIGLLNNALANSAMGRRATPRSPAGPVRIAEQYVVADLGTLAVHEAMVARSETEARQMLRDVLRNDPRKRAQLAVLPLFEVAP